ncbi:hypothetical protein L6164_010442 [Bauhinia variegata]|uniref:Uncharacterized protein n=1 Tax=Bauhinia variegata TaxID=167791 RepID=A0ACB9PM84_BAUVA|nr:hypothetical protein L6164_010442 [Bauhinia variegata]
MRVYIYISFLDLRIKKPFCFKTGAMVQLPSTASCDDNGIYPLPLYANATYQVVSEEQGLVRIQNASASASYQSHNLDDGFSYVLKLLDDEDHQTRADLVAQYQEFSKTRPPIGLQLRKSPSVLEMFDNQLNPPNTTLIPDKPDKFKPAHFPISVLQIGNFTEVAKREGDLVAKCYYAKRKLVWETLDHGLKNKIEIQWEDILSMRAVIEQNKAGILLIELNQPPTFWHEKDPKPGKHTIWKPSKDFTGNQASKYRRHFLEFPPGVLDKHYEKLTQCDSRLLELSKGPCPRLANPYFPCDFCNASYVVRGSNSTCQFGIQSPTSDIHSYRAINSQRLEDSELAISSQADFTNLSIGFKNLSDMMNMMLTTDSDPETVCKERHMAKVKSLCSFAGLSMELETDSWGNANANLHVHGQLSQSDKPPTATPIYPSSSTSTFCWEFGGLCT